MSVITKHVFGVWGEGRYSIWHFKGHPLRIITFQIGFADIRIQLLSAERVKLLQILKAFAVVKESTTRTTLRLDNVFVEVVSKQQTQKINAGNIQLSYYVNGSYVPEHDVEDVVTMLKEVSA